MREPILLLTGAGASVEYGIPGTTDLTHRIEQRLIGHGATTETGVADLYRAVVHCLKEYLPQPDQVTFEQVYQAVTDVYNVAAGARMSNDAPDESFPIVAATHRLRQALCRFGPPEAFELQRMYRRTILEVVLEDCRAGGDVSDLQAALARLSEASQLWSFTLNYDDVLDRSLDAAATGFGPGPEPRRFEPILLSLALRAGKSMHCHLHGCVRWGYASQGEPYTAHCLRDVYEYDAAQTASQHWEPVQSVLHHAQSGRCIPYACIVTGLSKTDELLEQPYFAYHHAFHRAVEQCSTLICAGYGFGDLHVNAAIRELFVNRAGVQMYIVDHAPGQDASDYVDRIFLRWEAYLTLTRGEWCRCDPQEINGFPGWSCLSGDTVEEVPFPPIGVWLGGFRAFCQAVALDGLPALPCRSVH